MQLDSDCPPKIVIFNGITFGRMGGSKKYYLSQSKSNAGRKGAIGLHRAIYEFYSGETVPKGYHIHHKDSNPLNNNFENLECLPAKEHERLPKKMDRQKNKEQLDKVRHLATEWHRSSEGREWHKKHSREMVHIPKNQKECQSCNSEFLSKFKTARYCSHKCGSQYRWKNKEKYSW